MRNAMFTTNTDQALTHALQASRELLILTGAGCSTDAGLGDYRDRRGQWKRKQPITGQEFVQSDAARRRYWARSAVGWPGFAAARPTAAHHALVRLQQRVHAPMLVTQNVDRLHQQAGHREVVDLHGRLDQVRCLHCGQVDSRDAFQARLIAANPDLADLDARYAPDGDADLEYAHTDALTIPACLACGGVVKPHVVFFGENVARQTVDRVFQALDAADALLVVGSSLMVYSGFRFCRHAAAHGKPVLIVNDGVTRADSLATLKLEGHCAGRLEAALAHL